MKKRKGFTLIEIMIVVTVIGVLAATAAVSYGQNKRRSQYRAMRAKVRVLTDAVKSYFYTMQSFCVTTTTARTNLAYGTMLHEGNFCRYRVYLSSGNPRVQVDYFRRGCGTGSRTGRFRFNVSGDQISCSGSDCMT